jgi:hypothetical protein
MLQGSPVSPLIFDDLDKVAVILAHAFVAIPPHADHVRGRFVFAAIWTACDIDLMRAKIFAFAILLAGIEAASFPFLTKATTHCHD